MTSNVLLTLKYFIRVSRKEWHPFTISSAPEVRDHFTLHIRGVGNWTNKLHELIRNKVENKQNNPMQRISLSKRERVGRKNIETEDRMDGKDNFQDIIKEIRKDEVEESMPLDNHDEIHNNKISKSTSLIENTKLRRRFTMRKSKSVRFGREFVTESTLALEQKTDDNKVFLDEPFEIFVDGPFGSPSSNIYRAEHAVLIGTGIGITPFASILQSIMHRYLSSKISCPNCYHQWMNGNIDRMFNLRKVDFFWINRDHTQFEWFVNLLSQLEIEQQEHEEHVNEGHMSR